jgi:hypothetical protein
MDPRDQPTDVREILTREEETRRLVRLFQLLESVKLDEDQHGTPAQEPLRAAS